MLKRIQKGSRKQKQRMHFDHMFLLVLGNCNRHFHSYCNFIMFWFDVVFVRFWIHWNQIKLLTYYSGPSEWHQRRWLSFYDPITNCAIMYVFSRYFEHNVSAIVSYDRKKLLDVRTAISHPMLEEYFVFNVKDGMDLFQTPDKTLIPVIHRRKRQGYWGRRSGCLVRRVVYLYHRSY